MAMTAQYVREHFDELLSVKDGDEIRVEREDRHTFRLTLVPREASMGKVPLFGIAKGQMWVADDWDSAETNKEIEDSFYASELE